MIAALAALAACGGEKARSAAPSAPQRPPHPVSTALVERSGAGEVTIPAVVAARQSATLAARLSAAVRELPRREGETVAAGEVVARLDDTALRASPFAGVIAARKVEVGDVVSPGQPLVIVEGRGGLELRASVTAEESKGLKQGSEVEARVDGIPDPLRARVTALSPAGDPATHRFELKADLPPAEELRSGLFARLALPGATGEEGALTVPAEAVFPRGGLTGVFVADGDTARLRWIAVGATAGNRVEVRAGLAAGERVVIAPGPLADGDPILPSNRKEGK